MELTAGNAHAREFCGFRPEAIINDKRYRRMGQISVNVLIRKSKWQRMGHTLRKGGNFAAGYAMQWKPLSQADRKVGHHRFKVTI